MAPIDLLRLRRGSIDAVLTPAGFSLTSERTGGGSGGPSATCRYERDDGRCVELHVRATLGIVNYRFDGLEVSHVDLMQAVGAVGRTAYPGFAHEAGDNFERLATDLHELGEPFLARGNEAELREMIETSASRRKLP